MTFAEIRFGIERQGDPARRRELGVWLDRTLRPYFGTRALTVSEDVVLRWRLLIDAGRRRVHVFAQLDLFLAATAVENELVTVSRDTTHFAAAGVPVLDPWTGVFIDASGPRTVIPRFDSTDLLARLQRRT